MTRRQRNLGRNFLSCELFANGGAVEFDVVVVVSNDFVRDLLGLFFNLKHLASNEPLNEEESVLEVNDCLMLGDLANEPVTILGVGHDGGSGSLALSVGDDNGLTAFLGGHNRVGGSQIDIDHFLINHSERVESPGYGLDLDKGSLHI